MQKSYCNLTHDLKWGSGRSRSNLKHGQKCHNICMWHADAAHAYAPFLNIKPTSVGSLRSHLQLHIRMYIHEHILQLRPHPSPTYHNSSTQPTNQKKYPAVTATPMSHGTKPSPYSRRPREVVSHSRNPTSARHRDGTHGPSSTGARPCPPPPPSRSPSRGVSGSPGRPLPRRASGGSLSASL